MTHLIAYNKKDLDALIITEKAATWHKKGWISTDIWTKIKDVYKSNFYTPNVFMRVGAFIFCSILIFATLGLFAIGSNANTLSYVSLFVGIVAISILEVMIKSKHYQSGVDEALLYCGLSLIIGSLTEILKLNTNELPFYGLFLPILVIAAIRYVDGLITTMAYGFLLVIVILITLKFPTIAPLILSFVVMLFAATLYFRTMTMQQNSNLRFWKNNLNILEAWSVITFYASGNYFILQQANIVYFNNPVVGMATLFWIFTFSVPFLYIYQGLKQKNRLLLAIGLLAIAAAVATFRYYFHVMPMEIAAIVAGALLLSIAYFAIKYLKNNKTPFTYEEDGEKPFYHQAESLIIAQTLGSTATPETKKPLFGGGDFGGGGAGNEF